MASAGLGWVLSSTAQTDVEPPRISVDEATQFAIGNVEFILLHELAHLLIRDLGVPILGSEESAADHIATLVLVDASAGDDLLATADGLAATWTLFQRANASANYWDSHALTIQRSLAIVCLMYGSDPGRFADLPKRAGMPKHRIERCKEEFALSTAALVWFKRDFGRLGGEPLASSVSVAFGEVPSRTSARILRAMQAEGVLEDLLQRLGGDFEIAEPFKIAFSSCGLPQAGWLPETRELYVCYELFDYFYTLALTRPPAGSLPN
jgi:hypothetical protein